MNSIAINYTDFKEFMRVKGWRQNQLAEHIGVTPAGLSKYIAGKRLMPTYMVVAIRDLLDMDAGQVNSFLLGGKE